MLPARMSPLVLVVVLGGSPVGKVCPPPDGGVQEIRLGVGTQKVLTVKGPVSEVRVINPEVVDVEVLGTQQLLLIGAGEGLARLEFRDHGELRRYGVRGRLAQLCGLRIAELDALFPCDSTLELRMIGDRVYLDGEASSAAEWDAALLVAERYPTVTVLGRVKAEVIAALFREANVALGREGFPRARFVRAGDAVLLEGEVPEGDEKKYCCPGDVLIFTK